MKYFTVSIRAGIIAVILLLGVSAYSQTPPPVAPDPASYDFSSQKAKPTPSITRSPSSTTTDEEKITLQFPRTTVNEILSLYELLTGKRMIRDSKLIGDELSISAQKPVSKSDAIQMIEAALLLNGYSLVPVDRNTMKILGASKTARAEGVQLIASPEDLPAGDQIVSYYMPLHYISAQEAGKIFQGFVKLNTYGSIVPLSNASAIVITDKTSLIRTLIDLQKLIDKPPAQISTHFVILKRANAEKVVEILDKMFSKEKKAAATAAGGELTTTSGDGATTAALLSSDAGSAESIRFIADERTNRVVVVCKNELFPQMQSMIEQLDASVDLERPLQRSLKYAKAAEVLPVLAKLIAESKEDIKELKQETGDGVNSSREHQGLIKDDSGGSSGGNSSFGGNSASGGGSGSIGGDVEKDRLNNPDEALPPECIIVGKTRLIADSAANTVIVIGPPESRSKAERILDILDRKPLQIYLATLIGELRLDNGMDYGFNYVVKFNQLNGSGIGGKLRGGPLGTDVLPGPAQVLSGTLPVVANAAGVVTAIPGLSSAVPSVANTIMPAATAALPALSGLTLFGSIADSVDIFAHFLEATNRFRTISRPVLYTTNNKKAVILSGQKIPYPSNSLTSVTPGLPNSSAINSTIVYQDVVLKLEVVPLINSNNEVTLVISQQNNTIAGNTSIAGQDVPIINTQKLTTTVTVPNSSTVVLGGLITEDKREDKTGIPYLSRLPYVGALFGTTSKAKGRKELIVMIQPIIIDSDKSLYKHSSEEVARPEIGEAVFERSRPPERPTPTPTPTPQKSRKL
ncbi:MAG: secretin N-terminal domain-containing protein [Chthoniobacterales bacterium]